MKTIIFYLGILLAFILLSVSSNAKQVQVNLKVNEELIYEWKCTHLLPSKAGPSEFWGQNIIRYSLLMNKIENNKVFFTARILHDIYNSPYLGNSNFNDYGFPQLVNYFQTYSTDDILERILYRIPFKFELDLTSRTIALSNRDEIQDQCRLLLSSMQYPEQLKSETINILNKNALQDRVNFFLQPFQFIKADLDQNSVSLQKPGLKLMVKPQNAEQLQLHGIPNDTVSQTTYIIDLQDGIIKSSSRKMPNIKKGIGYLAQYHKSIFETTAEKFTLIQKSIRKPKKVIVCGHIDNPVSKQVELYTLNKFIGSDLDSKTVYLDKAGNFRIESRLENEGLIALVNSNKTQYIVSVPILLYASPGDSIYLNTSLKQQKFRYDSYYSSDSFETNWRKFMVPHGIVFTGDRSKEAGFLNKFQNLPDMHPFEIQNNHLFANNELIDARVFLNALTRLDQMTNSLSKDFPDESAKYLQNELQAWLYTNLFDAHVNDPKSMWLISSNGPTITEKMKDFIFNQLDTFNIQRIYNDYGIFSRGLTPVFVRYKSQRLNNMNSLVARLFGMGFNSDPEQSFQFCKMVLNGSALYREAANQLYTYSLNPYRDPQNNHLWQDEIDETFRLMIERCNDEAFIQSLTDIMDNRNRWSNPRYLPNIEFSTPDRKKTTLHSIISKKPTLFFASRDWSVGGYEMDEAARQYPEFNFVHIDDGSNFDLWKGWNDRAKPVAYKLFLETDSLSLENVFLKNIGKYLIYDHSGKRIGIENELNKAISIAKESSKSKNKEIGKSTLQGIIIVLSASLAIFLIWFLAYKLRMNRRLKIQTQEKRLRELQMAAIRAQMNPHFLFNSLNSVQNLVQQNKNQEAHLYLSDFAGLIRKVLRNSEKEEVSLTEELETLEQYLNLEKLRFDFIYTIEVDIQIDQDLFMLPSMILQPIAENAIIHGLQHKTGDKKLSVLITKIENAIQISIVDNGIGIKASEKLKTNSNGVGLRMNEERIQMMKEKYGGNYSFRLIDLTEKGKEGTRVEIVIPEEQ
jgi:hypothetical protein